MSQRAEPAIRTLRVKKGDNLKTIYAKARKAFTAADLEKFAEIEVGVPARGILAELEAADKAEARRRKTKATHGRKR